MRWFDSVKRDKVSEKFDFGFSELALVDVYAQSVHSEALKQYSKVLSVLLFVDKCDENVVQARKYEVEALEYFVHEALESLCSITQTERHPCKFK